MAKILQFFTFEAIKIS